MLADLFLFLVGSKNEINCRPVQLLSSQILVSVIVIPILNLLSDPDYINQCIIWLVNRLSYLLISIRETYWRYFNVSCSVKISPLRVNLSSPFFTLPKMRANWKPQLRC